MTVAIGPQGTARGGIWCDGGQGHMRRLPGALAERWPHKRVAHVSWREGMCCWERRGAVLGMSETLQGEESLKMHARGHHTSLRCQRRYPLRSGGAVSAGWGGWCG